MEVYHNGEWSAVCDDGWNLDDAHLVCRELGFSKAISTRNHGISIQDVSSICLNNLKCVGTEWTITNCSYKRERIHFFHRYSGGVKCVSGNIFVVVTVMLNKSS